MQTSLHTKGLCCLCLIACLLKLLPSPAFIEIQAFHSTRIYRPHEIPEVQDRASLLNGNLAGKQQTLFLSGSQLTVTMFCRGIFIRMRVGWRSRVQILTRRVATWWASWIRPWMGIHSFWADYPLYWGSAELLCSNMKTSRRPPPPPSPHHHHHLLMRFDVNIGTGVAPPSPPPPSKKELHAFPFIYLRPCMILPIHSIGKWNASKTSYFKINNKQITFR
jgi:hypothetical protein